MYGIVCASAKVVLRRIGLGNFHPVPPRLLDEWTDVGIGKKIWGFRLAAIPINGGEGRNDKNMMTRRKLAKIWTRRLAFENVRQSICSGLNGISGLWLGKNVHDHQFAALVGRFNHRAHGSVVEHRDRLMRPWPRAPIVVNDLYIVGAFRDAGVYKRLCLFRPGERWYRATSHLCRMTAGRGCSYACGPHVGKIRPVFRLHLLDPPESVTPIEHIKLGGYT